MAPEMVTEVPEVVDSVPSSMATTASPCAVGSVHVWEGSIDALPLVSFASAQTTHDAPMRTVNSTGLPEHDAASTLKSSIATATGTAPWSVRPPPSSSVTWPLYEALPVDADEVPRWTHGCVSRHP